MVGWPYNEDDQMEIGETGWFPVGEGTYMNRYNNHIIDSLGREFDEDGKLIYDPNGKNDED
jgi:hypothetical protein